jgi:hypothetical protein
MYSGWSLDRLPAVSTQRRSSIHPSSPIMCGNYLDAGTALALGSLCGFPVHSRGLYEDQHSCMVVGCGSGVHGTSASRSARIGKSRGSRRPGCRARADRRWIFQLPPSGAPSDRGALRSPSGAGRAVPPPPREALETQRISRDGRLLHRRPVLRPNWLGPPAGPSSRRLPARWPVLQRRLIFLLTESPIAGIRCFWQRRVW